MHMPHARALSGLCLGCVLALSSIAQSAEPAAGAAPAAGAPNPIPEWIKVGADLRLRHEFVKNPFLVDSDPPGHTWSFNRYRGRLWSSILPNEPVNFNVRWTWEGRYWFEPDTREGFHNNEIVWDSLNAQFKLGDAKQGTSVTATIGRQDIILGDGWLVLEGTPLDGSRTIYFDAARFNVNVSKNFALDAIYIYQRADQDSWLRPFNSDEVPVMEQNEQGLILWATARCSEATTVNGYFIWKHDDAYLANGDNGDVYTIGGRVVHQFSKNLSGRVEGAYQFGNRDNPAVFPNSNGELCAFGTLSRLTYSLNDAMKNQFYVEYEYLSGDDPGSRRNEQFDTLWGRWPQYSELYVYQAAADTRIAETSNMNRIGLGWMSQPTAKLGLSASYMALFAPETQERAGFGDGHFRGHLFSAIMKYQFSKNVSGHLWGEYFIPGNYYEDAPGGLSSRQDPTMFLRAELMIGM